MKPPPEPRILPIGDDTFGALEYRCNRPAVIVFRNRGENLRHTTRRGLKEMIVYLNSDWSPSKMIDQTIKAISTHIGIRRTWIAAIHSRGLDAIHPHAHVLFPQSPEPALADATPQPQPA